MKGKRVLFYSSIKEKELFNIQRFYRTDIQILEDLGYTVILSNRIADSLCFWKYDFVFAYFYRYSFFVALIAKFFGKNSYFTGGIDALDKNLVSTKGYLIQRLFFKLCYLLSKRCIIVSKTDKANVNEIVDDEKLAFSEHSIDTVRFSCDLDKKEDLMTTIVWQGSVSNVRRKGVDIALRLYAMILQKPQYSSYEFVIIGKNGEGTAYLKNLVKELGIENKVIFTGSVSEEDKIEYLKRSKYYFQLSLFEGFGVASLEALCAKNIVIHSGKGGLSNSVYDKSVLINIDQPLENMYKELCDKLLTCSDSSLVSASELVCKQYDDSRRREDFSKIIDE